MSKLFTVIFFLFGFGLMSQQTTDARLEVVGLLKQYKLEDSGKAVDDMEMSFAKMLFEKELDYLKSGKLVYTSELLAGNVSLDLRDSILFRISLAKYHGRKTQPNHTEYFENYLSAYEISTRVGDTILINEALLGLNHYFQRNHIDTLLYRKYVNLLFKYKKDKIDDFWQKYYLLNYKMNTSSFSKEEFKEMEQGFLTLEKNAPEHDYFLGKIQHLIGIFYSYPSDYKRSREYFEKAASTYNSDYYYSNSRKIRTEVSLAITDFKDKAYSLTIEKLENALNNKFVKQDEKLKFIIYDWLAQSYEQFPSQGNRALYYLKMKDSTDDKLKMHAIVQKNREIEIKHEVAKKDKNIKNLQMVNQGLQDRLVTLLPILGILTILAIIIFFLYKKYYRKTTVLETEKSETLQKLDELKNIVIKNHIILKDKTKVYISDLMYIKSDDHYLNVYTSDDKNHFVRGKLSTIREELPPNFIQCHRSYIVNSNFIKRINNDTITLVDKTQVPLSRSFKNKF
ncbi:LytTR family transcriptional regulator [Aggregatimonas sangjinii]|uniref:LytTR family transcriptional regulator n=1 Tax=Aggregatimonas sangjinii TaxID=2583587 RepID=A0A5B7SXM3_9FLAO|nr:LytTR family DNA-binding domain-containing protein [Aggregatimonas sangjinii]QCX01641.1 LytTR family transcriptional regulator [Aggregatimonas sangjinii]